MNRLVRTVRASLFIPLIFIIHNSLLIAMDSSGSLKHFILQENHFSEDPQPASPPEPLSVDGFVLAGVPEIYGGKDLVHPDLRKGDYSPLCNRDNFDHLPLASDTCYLMRGKPRQELFATAPYNNGEIAQFITSSLNPAAKRILISVAHGTFSRNNPDFNDPSNARFRSLIEWCRNYSRSLGLEFDVIAYRWNGENSSRSRCEAGKNLAQFLDVLRGRCQTTTLWGHSHGCNVNNAATNHLTGKPIETLIHIASPVRESFDTSDYTPKFSGCLINLFSFHDLIQMLGMLKGPVLSCEPGLEELGRLASELSTNAQDQKTQKPIYQKMLSACLKAWRKTKKTFVDGRTYDQPQSGNGITFNIEFRANNERFGHSALPWEIVPVLMPLMGRLAAHKKIIEKAKQEQRELLKKTMNTWRVHYLCNSIKQKAILVSIPTLKDRALEITEGSLVNESTRNKKIFHLLYGKDMDELDSWFYTLYNMIVKLVS